MADLADDGHKLTRSWRLVKSARREERFEQEVG